MTQQGRTPGPGKAPLPRRTNRTHPVTQANVPRRQTVGDADDDFERDASPRVGERPQHGRQANLLSEEVDPMIRPDLEPRELGEIRARGPDPNGLSPGHRRRRAPALTLRWRERRRHPAPTSQGRRRKRRHEEAQAQKAERDAKPRRRERRRSRSHRARAGNIRVSEDHSPEPRAGPALQDPRSRENRTTRIMLTVERTRDIPS